MKVVVKKKDNAIPVAITTEYIKLQDAMKLANAAETGGSQADDSGGADSGQRRDLPDAGQETAPRRPVCLRRSGLPDHHP